MYDVTTIGGFDLAERLGALGKNFDAGCQCATQLGNMLQAVRQLRPAGPPAGMEGVGGVDWSNPLNWLNPMAALYAANSAAGQNADPLPIAGELFGPKGWGDVALKIAIGVAAGGAVYAGYKIYKSKTTKGKRK